MLTLLFIVSRFQYIFHTYKHIGQAQFFFLYPVAWRLFVFVCVVALYGCIADRLYRYQLQYALCSAERGSTTMHKNDAGTSIYEQDLWKL